MAGNLTTAVVGAAPGVIYGSPGSSQGVTVLNLDASNTVWLGYSASIAPAVGGGGVPVGPGASMQFDGGSSIYAVAETSLVVAVGPGVTGYFLPASLSNLGGITVYIQAGQPTGNPPVNSLWLQLVSGTVTGFYTWSGSAWEPQQFNASEVLAAGTVVANLIAAGTIVAGIVNGTTITAGTFIGSVFEGTDFTIDTSGIFFYGS